MRIDSMDHLVLTVADIDATCTFYERVLGMAIASFGEGRKALAFRQQKINLHQAGREFEPKALHPTPESADLCFITSMPLADVMAHLRANEVMIIKGPVERTGATDILLSLYFRDPDGNLIEVANSIICAQ